MKKLFLLLLLFPVQLFAAPASVTWDASPLADTHTVYVNDAIVAVAATSPTIIEVFAGSCVRVAATNFWKTESTPEICIPAEDTILPGNIRIFRTEILEPAQ